MSVDPGMGMPMQETVNLQMNTRDYEAGAGRAEAATQRIVAALDGVTTRLDGITRRSGQKLMFFGAGTVAGLTAVTAVAAKYDQQLSSIEAQQKMVGRSSAQMVKGIDRSANNLPVSRSELVEVTKTLNELGVRGAANLDKVRTTMVRLSAVAGESLPAVTRGLQEFDRAMGARPGGIEARASALARLKANVGGTATGTTQFAQSIAPIARVGGIGATQTLGIASAFETAGADGFAGANAFNSIVADITRLTQQGSPELAKYSNLIGKTAEQFKGMDEADRVIQIFEAIGKQGPEATKTLDRLGFDGIRTARSIQAVANQQGGLRRAVYEAGVGASRPDQFRDSAEDAMSGLNDSMAKLGNSVETAAKAIGDVLLPPVAEVADVMASLASGVSKVVKVLAPLIAAGGVTAAVGSLAGGGLLAGYKGAATVGGAAFVARSSPVGGVIGGIRAGRAQAMGAALPTGNPWVAQYAAQQAGQAAPFRRLAGASFSAGQRIGQFTAPIAMFSGGGGGGPRISPLERIVTAPAQGAAWWYNTSAQAMKDSTKPGFARQPMMPTSVFWGPKQPTVPMQTATTPTRMASFGWDAQAAQMRDIKAAREAAALQKDAAAATKEATKQTRAHGSALGRVSSAFGGAGAAFGRNVAAAAGATAGLAAQGISKAAPLVMGAMATPLGITAALGGGIAAVSWAKNQRRQLAEEYETPVGNSLSAYDEQLGKTTDALSDFRSALAAAADQARPKTGVAGDGVTDADVNLALSPGRELQVPEFEGATARSAAATFALGRVGEDVREAAAPDLVQVMGRDAAEEAIAAESDRPAYEAGVELREAPNGWNPFSASKATQNQSELLVEALNRQYAAVSEESGAPAAIQQQLVSVAEALEGIGRDEQAQEAFLTRAEASNILPEGFKERYQESYERTGDAGESFQSSLTGNNVSDDTKVFTSQLEDVRAVIGDVATMQANIPRLVEEDTTSTEARLKQTALGPATENSLVKSALANEGDPNKWAAGMKFLADQAVSTTGSFESADRALAQLQDTAGSVTSPLYELAQAARGAVSELRNIKAREASFAGAAGNASFGSELLSGPDPSGGRWGMALSNARQVGAKNFETRGLTGQEDAKKAEDEIRAMEAEGQQRLAAMVKSFRDYEVQSGRMQEDFNKSRTRAQRDYGKSVLRAQEDYQISSMHAEEDYLKSRLRSQEDFNTSLQRMIEDSAKSLYDPYKRAQAQFTYGADSLLVNLERQNELMLNQAANVDALRAAGMSDETIEQLGLTNPENRAQAERLAKQVAEDPSLVDQFNTTIAGRLDAAEGLVVDESNTTFARMQEDFKKAADRAEADFNEAMSRSREAFKRTMGRQSEDFAQSMSDQQADYDTAMSRSRDDLARMAEEIYGTITDLAAKAQGWIAKNIPGIGDAISLQIDEIVAKAKTSKEVLDGLFYGTNTDVRVATGPGGSGGITKAAGGLLTGPGTPTSDSIPLWGSTGEYVVKASSVSKYGVKFMDQLNAGTMPKFAEGGLIAAGVMATTTATMSSVPAGATITNIDESMHINGMTVVSNDPEKIQQQLKEQARRRQLVRPRAGSGV